MTSHLSEWPLLINAQTTSADEDVEKREPLCTVGGNADWGRHVENSMEFPQKTKQQQQNCCLTKHGII